MRKKGNSTTLDAGKMICPPRERHNENISAVGGRESPRQKRKTGLIASGEERKRPMMVKWTKWRSLKSEA